MSETIQVEVAYALPEKQRVVKLEVAAGTTVLQADMVGFPRLDQDSSMTCPRTPPPQADMVGFTKLSATHPPQRVLGLLSDIFEASDRPCETRRVEG